jgi:hypothetical protein
MKEVADLCKWLLEKDIRAKNAASFLVALLSLVIFYFTSKHCLWFQELRGYAAIGVAVALLVVFLIAFLSAWLVYSAVATYCQRVVSRRKARHDAQQQQKTVRSNLDSLTDWQRRFLLRFIVEHRTQIPEFEVGGFKAAWDFEMAVLTKKGIIKEHRRAGVFEIEPVYHQYLLEHWNPDTGALE